MKIKFKNIVTSKKKLEEKLLPHLLNRVFHVTSPEGYLGIMEDRMLRHNKDGNYNFTFDASKNSYGRNRGYVCLFDLRDKSDKEIQEALMKYYFLNPSFCRNSPYYIVISDVLYDFLIGWEKAEKETNFREMFIPYVECWYPGNIALECVEIVINAKIIYPEAHLSVIKSLI